MKFLLEKVPFEVAKYLRFITQNGVVDELDDITDIENTTARELSWDEFTDIVYPDADKYLMSLVVGIDDNYYYLFDSTDFHVVINMYDKEGVENAMRKNDSYFYPSKDWIGIDRFQREYDKGGIKLYKIKKAEKSWEQHDARNANNGYRTITGHHTYSDTKKRAYDKAFIRATDEIAHINEMIDKYNQWYLDGETDKETYIEKIKQAEWRLKAQEMAIVKAYNDFKTKDADRYKKQSNFFRQKRDEVKELIRDIRYVEEEIEDFKQRITDKETDLSRSKERLDKILRRR